MGFSLESFGLLLSQVFEVMETKANLSAAAEGIQASMIHFGKMGCCYTEDDSDSSDNSTAVSGSITVVGYTKAYQTVSLPTSLHFRRITDVRAIENLKLIEAYTIPISMEIQPSCYLQEYQVSLNDNLPLICCYFHFVDCGVI